MNNPSVFQPGEWVRFKRRMFPEEGPSARHPGELVEHIERINRISAGGLLAEFGFGKESFAVRVEDLERVNERTPDEHQPPKPPADKRRQTTSYAE